MEQQDQGGPRYVSFFVTAILILLMWRMMTQPQVPVQVPEDPAQQGDDPNITGVDKRTPLDSFLPVVQPPGLETADTPDFATVGSLDPASAYRMQVNFASRGGVVHRIQLASPKYRDIDDRAGFFGAIEPKKTASGITIRAIQAGSPAEAAGLEVGDIITAAGLKDNEKVEIEDAEALRTLLADTKPKQTLTVDYTREGQAKSAKVSLTRAPLNLIRPEGENILLHSKELPEKFVEHPSFELQIDSVGPTEPPESMLEAANLELRDGKWALETPDANTVVFRKRVAELQLEFVKTFQLDEVPEGEQDNGDYPAYDLDFDVEVINLSSKPQTVAYRVQGPNGLPIEGWWYSNKIGESMFGAVGIRDVIVRVFDSQREPFSCATVAKGDAEAVGQGASIAYAGIDAQYFAAAVFPQKEVRDDRWIDKIQPALASTKLDKKTKPLKYNNASFTMTRVPAQLAPAGETASSQKDQFLVFAGPKKPELLDQYTAVSDEVYSIGDFVYYGWFSFIARPMLWLLHTFAGWVGNYGLAIIMLTVVVRASMMPISRKQVKNMAKMQELKPEIDRINAKYKEDMQKRAAAQQELWKKHGYNPMSGCLPMFLQFPIFIGLYRSLMVDVELRQTPLISESVRWCSNLAAPDMFYDWSSWWWLSFNNGNGFFALGPYFNILPLATVGLFILQQKMFMPPATDDQTRMTQRVMQYMMIFMGFMFFKVAAGLCIYFIASSLWGIAERKLIPRPTPPTQSSPPPEPKRKKQVNEESAKAAEKSRRKKKKGGR